MLEYIPENPYLLLTPGPLSTSKGVRRRCCLGLVYLG